jgi:hypothetical protein
LTAVLVFFAIPVVAQDFDADSDVFLFPEDMRPINPLFWVHLVRRNASFRFGVFVAAAIQAIGAGWLIRLAARPRTEEAALAAGVTTAMVACLVAFSFLGPLLAVESSRLQGLRLHPIQDPLRHAQQLLEGKERVMRQEIDMPSQDAEYLSRHLSSKDLSIPEPEKKSRLKQLQIKAVYTNQSYAASVEGLALLVLMLLFFVGLTQQSTWAADYLCRSGRGPLACAFCYLELYPPAAALLVWCIIAFLVALTTLAANVSGGPKWGQLLLPTALGAGLVTLAHLGVIQRWHPARRGIMYLAYVGLGVAVIIGVL